MKNKTDRSLFFAAATRTQNAKRGRIRMRNRRRMSGWVVHFIGVVTDYKLNSIALSGLEIF